MCLRLRRIIFSVFISEIATGLLERQSGMDRLYRDLMLRYNKVVRPVINPQDRVTISFSSSLIQIVDVEWIDYRLKWDPFDPSYDNITEIQMSPAQLWTPDIVLYNDAGGSPQIKTHNSAKIHYSGTVLWKPPAIFTSFCELNMQMFPYDDQHCELKFGTWSYDGTFVDIQFARDPQSCDQTKVVSRLEPGMNLANYIANVEWAMLNISAVRHEKIYPGCCGDIPYIDITYYLHIRRLKLFHTVNLLVPCVMVSILTCGVFYMPCESQEKLTLCISILVTLSVFLLFLTDMIPPTSTSVSLIERFILVDMVLVSSCIAATIVTEYLKLAMSDRKMGRFVRWLFLDLWGPWLRVSEKKIKSKSIKPLDETTPLLNHSESIELKITTNYYKKWKKNAEIIRKTLENVSLITEYYKEKEEEEKLSNEWNKVAMVFDRICFWSFGIASICAIGFFLSPVVFAKDDKTPLILPMPTRPLV